MTVPGAGSEITCKPRAVKGNAREHRNLKGTEKSMEKAGGKYQKMKTIKLITRKKIDKMTYGITI